MASKQQTPPRSEEQQAAVAEQGTVIAIILLLLAGYSFAALSQGLIALLAPLGVTPAAAEELIKILGVPGLTITAPTAPVGSASVVIQRGEAARRALYIVRAAKRLTDGGTVKGEANLFRAHQVAEGKRTAAVEQIDEAASKYGPLLGWHAILDEVTTPLCRAANGRNFRAGAPPQIGYPGTAHGGNCRCRAGRPFPDGTLLP